MTVMLREFSPNVQIDATFPDVKILDVTLRDGAFAVDFRWTEEAVLSIAQSLADARIPFIELGYYGGGVPEPPYIPDKGITANVPLRLVKQLATDHPETAFALMIHPDRIDIDIDFGAIKDAGTSLLRFVYHPSWDNRFRTLVKAAQAEGLETSLNLAMASRYAPESLLSLCEELSGLRPSIIYLADTCSALYPHQVRDLYTCLSSVLDVRLGFHAHDFLSLAFANALAAAQAGAVYIDASVLGLGRGAGNLRSEIWCVSATAQGRGNFSVEPLLEAINHAREYAAKQQQDIAAIVAGACNLTPAEEELLRSTATKSRSEGSMDLLACRYVMNRANLGKFSSQSLTGLLVSPPGDDTATARGTG